MNRLVVKGAIGLLTAIVFVAASTAKAQGPPGGGPPSTPDCGVWNYELDGGTNTLWNADYLTTVNPAEVVCAVYVTDAGNLTLWRPNLVNLQAAGGGSGLEANQASVVKIYDGNIVVGGVNGIYTTGTGSTVFMKGGSIVGYDAGAHGVDAMACSTINLEDVNISTEGSGAAGAIVNDTGNGMLNARNVYAHTTGPGSPGFYGIGGNTYNPDGSLACGPSTFHVKDSTLVATTSDGGAAVVGAEAYVTNSRISGFKEGILVNGTLVVDGGVIAGAGTGVTQDNVVTAPPGSDCTTTPSACFNVPNGNAINSFPFGAPATGITTNITVKNGTVLKASTGTILYATQNTTTNFNVIDDSLTGNILADAGSPLTVTLTNSGLSGTITNAALNLDRFSVWDVTANSVLTTLSDYRLAVLGNNIINIAGNGHTVTYDPTQTANAWLGGKTYKLLHGGELTPQ